MSARPSRLHPSRALLHRRAAPGDVRAAKADAAELAGAHAELGRRQSFTNALLETIEVGIVSCDANGVFVVSNRAERQMFGFDKGIDGLVSGQIDARIDVYENGTKLPWYDYPLLRALRGDDVSKLDVVAGPVGGPYRDIVVRARQIIGSDGDVLGAVAALTDVTAERVAERALTEEHRKLAEAQRLGQTGSFEYDFRTKTWTCSDNLCVLWGVAPGALTLQAMESLVVAEDWPSLVECWRAVAGNGQARSFEFRLRRANDGQERLIRATIEIEPGDAGEPLRGRGTNLDITDLDAAKKAVERANAFFDAVLTASPDYTFVAKVETGTVIYGSRGSDILGLDTDKLDSLGNKGILALAHPRDRGELARLNASASRLADGQVAQAEYRALHVDGQWRWLSQRVTPFRRDKTGQVVEVLSVVRDVTELVEAERRLFYAARHDYLTGLPNRALLIERLEAALARAGDGAWPVAVLFCDLDGFKHVNDSGGHAAGDEVLRETARRLTSAVREGDTVARVGGDEFVVIVEPWNRDDARSTRSDVDDGLDGFGVLVSQLAARIADALRPPMGVGDAQYAVTVSIGIACAGTGVTAASADQMLQTADSAMYAAKTAGKNRFVIFDRLSQVSA